MRVSAIASGSLDCWARSSRPNGLLGGGTNCTKGLPAVIGPAEGILTEPRADSSSMHLRRDEPARSSAEVSRRRPSVWASLHLDRLEDLRQGRAGERG